MLRLRFVAPIVAMAVSLAYSPGLAEVFVYPKQGQNQEQFEYDQFQCHKWAKSQTGVDPTQPAQAASPPPPQGGQVVRGAAGGAALGAIGGAIGGDAGKGAAIGAGVGAAAGLLKKSRQQQQSQAAQQQAQAQAQAAQSTYDRAYGACMGGRGYQVR